MYYINMAPKHHILQGDSNIKNYNNADKRGVYVFWYNSNIVDNTKTPFFNSFFNKRIFIE